MNMTPKLAISAIVWLGGLLILMGNTPARSQPFPAPSFPGQLSKPTQRLDGGGPLGRNEEQFFRPEKKVDVGRSESEASAFRFSHNGSAVDIAPMLRHDPLVSAIVDEVKDKGGISLVIKGLSETYGKGRSLDWLIKLPSDHVDAVKFRQDFAVRASIWQAPDQLLHPQVWKAYVGYDKKDLEVLAAKDADLPDSVKNFVAAQLLPKKKPFKPKVDDGKQMVLPGVNDPGPPPALAPGVSALHGNPLPATLKVTSNGGDKPLLNETVYPRGFPAVGIVEVSGHAKCTGVLMAQTVVITAAHCFDDSADSRIAFFLPSDAGIDQLSVSKTVIKKGRRYMGQDFAIYPGRLQWTGDVALMFLREKVTEVLKFPEIVTGESSILRASSGKYPELGVPKRTDITFVAYGRSGTQVEDGFRELQIGWQSVKLAANETSLLAWLYDDGDTKSSSCLGDSGAPLFFGTHRGLMGERHVLVGIVSSVVQNCENGGAYSNFLDTKLVSWICSKAEPSRSAICKPT